MAALHGGGNYSAPGDGDGDGEAPPPPTTAAECRRGGWTAAPFIIGSVAGLTLASGGWTNNLIVFLIQQFNINNLNAAQINNLVSGCSNFVPLIAAILADSFLGCFYIICISSLISLLGLILLMLTVTINGLSPPKCETGSSFCASASMTQYSVLFAALSLVSIGLGGSSFTLATMGANQFSEHTHQSTYFNWYFFALYFSSFISATGIVYVEDNVSWGWGFGISIAGNLVGLALFLVGKPYYRSQGKKPEGSPFTSLLRVIVASVSKRKVKIPSQGAEYYYGDDHVVKGGIAKAPTNRFRALNRAALKTEEDIQADGSIAKRPWRLCTVQQVEDLKTLIKIAPLWSTSILLATPIGIQISLTVVQALTTDRHVGRHFQVPAGSMMVFSFISTAICTTLINHCLWPLWRKVARRNRTPLQQIGIGHVLNIASMAVSALVESKRRAAATGADIVKISVLWLVPQMVVAGIGEGFHFPGQVALYYQEFPTCLKSLATAMVAMLIAVAFYLSTAVINFVKRVTEWLPNEINDGRVDNVYWVMVVLGVFNFGYYLVCSWFYKYKHVRVSEEGDSVLDE